MISERQGSWTTKDQQNPDREKFIIKSLKKEMKMSPLEKNFYITWRCFSLYIYLFIFLLSFHRVIISLKYLLTTAPQKSYQQCCKPIANVSWRARVAATLPAPTNANLNQHWFLLMQNAINPHIKQTCMSSTLAVQLIILIKWYCWL